MGKVVVIGGGAAGLFAAYSAALNNKQVILLEKNEKLGKKIYITGKGRCNLTTSVPMDEFFNYIVSNPKFLFSSINNLSPNDVCEFFENNGTSLKEERGNRIFPASDKASDVTKTLEKVLISLGVDIRLNTTATELITLNGHIKGVKTDNADILCDSVIICCGGVSYPLTGSTGDGYAFARKLGHNIVELKPANGNFEKLCFITAGMLNEYKSDFCVESFDPRCVKWFKDHRPEFIRGQLSQNYLKKKNSKISFIKRFAAANLLTNVLTKPDFVAYKFCDRNNLSFKIWTKIFKLQGVTWTVTDKISLKIAENENLIPIFEDKKVD